jgi:hypothetical protein
MFADGKLDLPGARAIEPDVSIADIRSQLRLEIPRDDGVALERQHKQDQIHIAANPVLKAGVDGNRGAVPSFPPVSVLVSILKMDAGNGLTWKKQAQTDKERNEANPQRSGNPRRPKA